MSYEIAILGDPKDTQKEELQNALNNIVSELHLLSGDISWVTPTGLYQPDINKMTVVVFFGSTKACSQACEIWSKVVLR